MDKNEKKSPCKCPETQPKQVTGYAVEYKNGTVGPSCLTKQAAADGAGPGAVAIVTIYGVLG